MSASLRLCVNKLSISRFRAIDITDHETYRRASDNWPTQRKLRLPLNPIGNCWYVSTIPTILTCLLWLYLMMFLTHCRFLVIALYSHN